MRQARDKQQNHSQAQAAQRQQDGCDHHDVHGDVQPFAQQDHQLPVHVSWPFI